MRVFGRSATILAISAVSCGWQEDRAAQEAFEYERPALPEQPEPWAEALVDALAAEWPDDHRRPFLEAIAPMAIRSSVEHCVPASVTVAQAALESGWGQSDKALELNNLFGIKAADHEAGAVAPTWEVVDGQRIDTEARFRSFDSWAHAVLEHDRRIAEHHAYAAARRERDDWRAFISALAPVYATDPAYAQRITSLVEAYHLDALDAPALEQARARGACS